MMPIQQGKGTGTSREHVPCQGKGFMSSWTGLLTTLLTRPRRWLQHTPCMVCRSPVFAKVDFTYFLVILYFIHLASAISNRFVSFFDCFPVMFDLLVLLV
ncbi:hypothetical protein ACH5RR_016402 [Cinchona calisaya]|uniref:Uncharacterized protein n=1 Tax=Cinchona calisaya TaxID=153742 RepID=A0ABD2ZX14_9GENT